MLLLWLDEDALAREHFPPEDFPSATGLSNLADLGIRMLPRLTALLAHFAADSRNYDVPIIGPHASGTLIQLADEWLKPLRSGHRSPEPWPDG